MKKIIGLVLIALITLVALSGLVSCNNSDDTDKDLQGFIKIRLPSNLPAGVGAFNTPLKTELTAVYDGDETVNYQWNKDGQVVTGATSVKYIANASGKYTVSVSAEGYKSKESPAVTVVSDVKMTFVDDPDNPGSEFSIYDDFTFSLELFPPFLDKIPADEDPNDYTNMGLVPGLIVNGKVDTEDEWDNNLKGYAKDMYSNIEELDHPFDLNGVLGELDAVYVEFTYTKENDEIMGIKVEFPGEGIYDGAANMILGGDYVRKK